MANILLSAVGGPVAVGIIRHFQALGHYVIGTDIRDDAIGRDFANRFVVSPVSTDQLNYIPFLRQMLGEVDLFFPFIDEEILTIAENWNVLADLHDRLLVSPPATLLTCTDKIRFQALMEEAGFPVVPRTATVPAVVKPRHGRGGRAVVFVYSQAELNERCENSDILAQQYMGGPEYTVDILLDREGRWLQGVARRRLLARGVSLEGQIDQAEDVLALARRATEALLFRGPINIQIIRDETTNRPYLLEINPRLSGSVMFTVLAGFDLLAAAVNLHLFGESTLSCRIQNGLRISRYWSEKCRNLV